MTDVPSLRRVYDNSRLNRRFMTAGAKCRCLHCLSTFAPDQIKDWIDDGETALCPNCGIDAVLSTLSGPISEALLRRLRATYFDGPSHKYTADEWRAALAKQPRPPGTIARRA
jgi:NAD-dependent SIR2 family protein deacetylase